MTIEQRHRLLKRQLRKYRIDESDLDRYRDFFSAVNQAYQSFDKEVFHLESILELNSRELFVANSKLKEENLEKSKEALILSEKLDRVMENVPDIIFELDRDGNFTYLNSAWEKYGGEPVAKSIGKNFMAFANRIEYFEKEAFQKIQERSFEEFKTTYSRYDDEGILIWWEMSVKIIKDDRGDIEGAIGSLVDVTSLKETQQKLIKASEAKGQFLSTMSHEIRTPLNAVIAISNILLMEDPKKTQLDNLHALKFSSKHLLNLINDILDYNKMISGNLKFAKVPFNLRYTLDGIMSAYSYSANDKDIKLVSSVTPCVPEGAVGDHTRLSQVLSNLIGNAIKFTDKGSVTLNVSCLEHSDHIVRLLFEVIDTGIGIAPDKLEHIFERFTQAEDTTSLNYGGTGLGLAISKKILNMQESEIHVESEPGVGTKFWFELEYGKVDKKNLLDIDASAERVFDLYGVKLLVVDDNEMNIMVIEQFFSKWNIDYDIAVNGLEAVEKVQANNYNLVLMDLRMPVMDGYAATSEIRKLGGKYASLPIIALSASVSTEVIEKVTYAGMDDYLCKPFDPEDLYKKIQIHSTRISSQAHI